nr:hypothetical protein [Sphingomonas sp. CDS-1]
MSKGTVLDWYNGWSPEQRLATLPMQRAALKAGTLLAPTCCSVCGFDPREQPGTSNRVWLHNEDYGDPLATYAICRRCHWALHERFDDPEPWLAIVARHGTGNQWFERLSMDPASKRRPYIETYPEGLRLPR